MASHESIANLVLRPPIPPATTVNVDLNASSQAGKTWKVQELSLLIGAKRVEHETSLNHTARERIKTADQKWIEIQVVLVKDGIDKNATQIKKRWEKLVTDFKKVHDYQSHVGSGQESYYEMGSVDRKAKKLPVNFSHQLFESMVCWMGNNRAINPSPHQVMDTGSLREDSSQALEVDGERTPPPPTRNRSAEIDDEVTSPPCPIIEASSSAATTEQIRPTSSKRTPPIGTQFTAKKSKREKVDDQFQKSTANFLDFLQKDSERKSQAEESLVAVDLEKHEQWMEQQTKMTEVMANAITGMADSIRYLATQISNKRK